MRNLALLIEVLDETMRLLPPTIPTFTKLKTYTTPVSNLRGKKQMTTFTSDDREEAYKKIVEAAPNQPGYEDAVPILREMNNEPVAWMSNGKEFYVQKNYCPDFIPLYTHPAKTLTDEEIKEVWMKRPANTAEDVIAFARAILRKAQE
jgi:hypothetical protein